MSAFNNLNQETLRTLAITFTGFLVFTLLALTLFFLYKIDSEAIKAGLVQKQAGSHIVWTKEGCQ